MGMLILGVIIGLGLSFIFVRIRATVDGYIHVVGETCVMEIADESVLKKKVVHLRIVSH